MAGNKGNIIAELRKEAGYTQKSLAEALHITDKAVSNWERGISRPDSALLPKLSLLLNADLEMLLEKGETHRDWVGLIDLRQFYVDLSEKILTQPLVYFLLSHFMLLNIRKVHFLTDENNRDYLNSAVFSTFGFQFEFDFPEERDLMIINRPTFLFGADLSRLFESVMHTDVPVQFVPQNLPAQVLFCPAEYTILYKRNPVHLCEIATTRTMGRGMICIDMDTEEKILDVANFIRIYRKNTGLLIGSLEEISYRKGILSRENLLDLCPPGNYGVLLRKVAET